VGDLSVDASVSAPPQPAHTRVAKRVIACLDVRSNDTGDLVVTKGDQYDVRERPVGGGGGVAVHARLEAAAVGLLACCVAWPGWLEAWSCMFMRVDVRVTGAGQDGGEEGRGEVRNLGKPVALAKRYYDEGADEVTFLNITSFRQVGPSVPCGPSAADSTCCSAHR
jgi:glutamine amidotransferase/cyclase